MLEEMSEPRAGGFFIPGTDIIEDVDNSHRGTVIAMDNNAKAVGKRETVELDHAANIRRKGEISGDEMWERAWVNLSRQHYTNAAYHIYIDSGAIDNVLIRQIGFNFQDG